MYGLKLRITFLFSLALLRICGQHISDTCYPKPVAKERSFRAEETSTKKTIFYAGANAKKQIFSYVRYSIASDCNSEGIEVAGQEWIGDTLRIYTFWCHAGDPTGWEWGARIMDYLWDCKAEKMLLLSSKLYIEMEGIDGGMPLKAEELKNPQAMKVRKEFIRNSSKTYNGQFIYGAEADHLIKRSRSFLSSDIEDATGHWKGKEQFTGSFKPKK